MALRHQRKQTIGDFMVDSIEDSKSEVDSIITNLKAASIYSTRSKYSEFVGALAGNYERLLQLSSEKAPENREERETQIQNKAILFENFVENAEKIAQQFSLTLISRGFDKESFVSSLMNAVFKATGQVQRQNLETNYDPFKLNPKQLHDRAQQIKSELQSRLSTDKKNDFMVERIAENELTIEKLKDLLTTVLQENNSLKQKVDQLNEQLNEPLGQLPVEGVSDNNEDIKSTEELVEGQPVAVQPKSRLGRLRVFSVPSLKSSESAPEASVPGVSSAVFSSGNS
jgi:hypothetical protein